MSIWEFENFLCVLENLSENEKSRVSYMKIVCSLCTCVGESDDIQDNLQNRIFDYFESTVRTLF